MTCCDIGVFHLVIITLATMSILKTLGNKFQLKQILIFWIKFPQKDVFNLKQKKVNTTIEFYIFKLV